MDIHPGLPQPEQALISISRDNANECYPVASRAGCRTFCGCMRRKAQLNILNGLLEHSPARAQCEEYTFYSM